VIIYFAGVNTNPFCDAFASVGTSMEVLYGWQLGKRVLIIAQGNVSPWLRYHCEAVFPTLADAVLVIR
jgi:hypothetical protein